VSCIQFTNHRAAQDELPPRAPSATGMFMHTVNHELVERVIAIKRLKEAEQCEVKETEQ